MTPTCDDTDPDDTDPDDTDRDELPFLSSIGVTSFNTQRSEHGKGFPHQCGAALRRFHTGGRYQGWAHTGRAVLSAVRARTASPPLPIQPPGGSLVSVTAHSKYFRLGGHTEVPCTTGQPASWHERKHGNGACLGSREGPSQPGRRRCAARPGAPVRISRNKQK